MEIKEEMNLQMKNVFSYRGKLTEKALAKKKVEIESLIKEFGAHPVHPAITTSYGADQNPAGPVIDMEVLIPLDKDVSHEVLVKNLPGYRFKPVFLLTNAVVLHHTGDANLEDSIKELYTYINARNMRPITTLYNITINDPDDPNDLVTDLMIGIDPNIL